MDKELSRISAAIEKKVGEYNRQLEIIKRNLEKNSADLDQAEAAKTEALKSGDEKGYKTACRAAADAAAGVEFNNKSRQALLDTPFASAEENSVINDDLHRTANEIFVHAADEIGKGLDMIIQAADAAIDKMNIISVLAAQWNKEVMKDRGDSDFAQTKMIVLQQNANAAKGRKAAIQIVRENDPAFRS